MAYNYDVPNQANIVRTGSGDLALMQGNFEHLIAVASGLLADGAAENARLLGFLYGDATKYNRFRVYWAASGLKIDRNVGSEASPSWQNVMTIGEGTGLGSASFGYVVSGQTPTAAAHLATKGYVDGLTYTLSGLTDTAVSGPTSGEILEWGGTGWANVAHAHALNDLTDVSLPSPASGEVLTYTGAQWEAVSGGGGSATLSGLTDTAISGPVSGEVLEWNGTGWANKAFAAGTLSGLTDTSVGGATSGQALVYNGAGTWVPGTATGGSETLSGLTDTAVSGATSGQVLEWDGVDWVPGNPTASGIGLIEAFDLAVDAVASGDNFTISLYAFYPYDVKTLRGKTSNGTCDLILKIDGTPITGLSGITVSGTETGWNASAANSVAIGNTLSFDVADATSCSGLVFSLKTERT